MSKNKQLSLADSTNKKQSVIKHSASIHISDKITLLQRRTWNVLLAHCYDNLEKEEKHTIKMSLLWDYLGGENNRPDSYVKNLLEELVGIRVKWNILGKDKDNEWGVTALLASCKIKNGICEYAFSPHLREKLYNPSLYARISLSLQNRFDSKHSLALYELAVDYFMSKKKFGETPFISLENFKLLMGLTKSEYTEFKILNRAVIKPSIEEINQKTDLFIEVEILREQRKVSALKFHIKENPAKDLLKIQNKEQVKLFSDDEVKGGEDIIETKKKFSRYGVSDENYYKYLSSYGPEKLEDVIFEIEKTGAKIKNIPGWIFKALSESYDLPEAKKERERQEKIKRDLEKKRKKFEEEELEKAEKERIDKEIEQWIVNNQAEYQELCKNHLEYLQGNNPFLFNQYKKGAEKKNEEILEYAKNARSFLGGVKIKIYNHYFS